MIGFIQTSTRRWVGKLLGGPHVTRDGLPATAAFATITESQNGSCIVLFQRLNQNGRRYKNYASLDDAQTAVIRWGARNFRRSDEA